MNENVNYWVRMTKNVCYWGCMKDPLGYSETMFGDGDETFDRHHA
jgi:hypothetical protein